MDRIFTVIHSKRTRDSGHDLWKGELTRCKEMHLPLEGCSVLEHELREAGESPAWDKFRSYPTSNVALSNLISRFSANLL